MTTTRVQITIGNITDSEHLAEVLEDLIFDIEHSKTEVPVHEWNDGVVTGRCEYSEVADQVAAEPEPVVEKFKFAVSLRQLQSKGIPPWALNRLMLYCGKVEPDDELIPVTEILDSNGLRDALWCVSVIDQLEFREASRKFSLWCAMQVVPYATDSCVSTAVRAVENCVATRQESRSVLDAYRKMVDVYRAQMLSLVRKYSRAARAAEAALHAIGPVSNAAAAYDVAMSVFGRTEGMLGESTPPAVAELNAFDEAAKRQFYEVFGY